MVIENLGSLMKRSGRSTREGTKITETDVSVSEGAYKCFCRRVAHQSDHEQTETTFLWGETRLKKCFASLLLCITGVFLTLPSRHRAAALKEHVLLWHFLSFFSPRLARVCYSASLTATQMTLPFLYFLLVTVCQDTFILASLGISWLFKTSKHVHTFSGCSHFCVSARTLWLTHTRLIFALCVFKMVPLNERWHLSPQREPEMDGSSNLWRSKITTCYASRKIAPGTLKLQFLFFQELLLMKFGH